MSTGVGQLEKEAYAANSQSELVVVARHSLEDAGKDAVLGGKVLSEVLRAPWISGCNKSTSVCSPSLPRLLVLCITWLCIRHSCSIL